jgi:hypothetical protein
MPSNGGAHKKLGNSIALLDGNDSTNAAAVESF